MRKRITPSKRNPLPKRDLASKKLEQEKLNKRFGERLKEIRESKNMTAKEVGDIINLTDATISRYENGLMEAKRTTIKVLAEYFGVNPIWLTGDEDAPKYLPLSSKAEFNKIKVLGTIAAGLPTFAEENIIGYEYVSQDEKIDFCLKVKGNSMIGARIYDGDIVFLKEQPQVENGEIAAVIINNEEATLKRFYKINGNVLLRAENPEYKDLVFSNKEMNTVRILGRAVYFKSEVQ